MKNIFLLLLSLVILCAGCGQSNEGGGKRKLKIAVIPKTTSHTFFRSVNAGALQAAKELNVTIDWQGPQKESDRQQQISIVQNFISRSMDAICLAPTDSRSLVKVVRDATQANIPVIIFDSGLDSYDFVSFVATDNYKGGQLCAERLVSALDDDAKKIIMLRHSEGSESTTNREEGFMDRLKEILPDAELLSTNQYGSASVEKCFQVAQNLLNRFGEIDGIFCPSEPTTQAMLRALQIAGRSKELKFVGFDTNSDLVDGLKKGEIDALAIQDPYKMGYLAVKTAVQFLQGEEVDERIDTGVHIITRENMDEEEMKRLLNPPVENG